MSHFILPRSVGTHDGSFHADEVTAVALLIVFDLIDHSKVMRTRDQGVLDTCEFVCDVGGIYDPGIKRFDHHQVTYKGMLSSAGMILEYLKIQKIISQDLYGFLNSSLIIGVDAVDNGAVAPVTGHCSFSGVITNFVPISYEAGSEEMQNGFLQALEFTIGHLKRLITRFSYIRECRDKVETAMKESKEVLVFDSALPWMDNFFELGGEDHPASFVIMPSGHHWKLRGIPPSKEQKMKVRKPLPESWAGLLDEDLKRVTNISGAIFCHKGRFISVWESKEDAFKALGLILQGKI